MLMVGEYEWKLYEVNQSSEWKLKSLLHASGDIIISMIMEKKGAPSNEQVWQWNKQLDLSEIATESVPWFI